MHIVELIKTYYTQIIIHWFHHNVYLYTHNTIIKIIYKNVNEYAKQSRVTIDTMYLTKRIVYDEQNTTLTPLRAW